MENFEKIFEESPIVGYIVKPEYRYTINYPADEKSQGYSVSDSTSMDAKNFQMMWISLMSYWQLRFVKIFSIVV